MMLRRLGLGLALLVVGCSSGADDPYKAAPEWSGRKPSLPPPPTISAAPIKVGDAYTVAGASHQLRSRIHEKDVTKADITIQGYIVEENVTDAPKCAFHKVGKADPEGCPGTGQPSIPIPSFWIADEKGAGKDKPRIQVLGWARNFAVVYEAQEKYKLLKEVKDPEKDLYKDEVWGAAVPFPMPAVGAKVKITGKYGFVFTKSTNGLVSDPVNGVMTLTKMDTVEPVAKK